jgi:hypothetical protein
MEAIMTTTGFDAETAAQQLGAGGVDNLVTNAERICTYEQQRIEHTNAGLILGLQGEYNLLVAEEHRIEERLQMAPPPGDLRRLHRRAIFAWSITAILTVAGFAFTLLSFASFRLGWKSWLYCAGIAVVTPFLVEKLLDGRNMEKLVKTLTALATAAALTSLMLLAVIRGDLLAQEFHQDAAPVVVIDDSAPQSEPQNTFYDSTLVLLRVALLLMAFTMEVGAGLALREARRSVPDSSEDWNKLRGELIAVRHRMSQIVCNATMLHNEPAIFAARFWRDFYSALLSNAARNAMTKLLMVILGLSSLVGIHAHAEDRLNLVVAIDLTQSVAVTGPDGKSDFQKNIEGVTRLLSQVSSSSHVTVIGITDRSFTQPYILLPAHVPDDQGYFGERSNSARGQLVLAWKKRATRLDPRFHQTDIFGALQLVSQIFAQQSDAGRRTLIIFSDMRQSTPELNLESLRIVPSFPIVAKQCGTPPLLRDVQVHILGADGPGKSTAYWESLQSFWEEYFHNAGTVLQSYSVLRELRLGTGLR